MNSRKYAALHPTEAAHHHLLHLGHLTEGGLPRCGCGADSLIHKIHYAIAAFAESSSWMPLRHQTSGFVLTRFIYSTRTLNALR